MCSSGESCPFSLRLRRISASLKGIRIGGCDASECEGCEGCRAVSRVNTQSHSKSGHNHPVTPGWISIILCCVAGVQRREHSSAKPFIQGTGAESVKNWSVAKLRGHHPTNSSDPLLCLETHRDSSTTTLDLTILPSSSSISIFQTLTKPDVLSMRHSGSGVMKHLPARLEIRACFRGSALRGLPRVQARSHFMVESSSHVGC